MIVAVVAGVVVDPDPDLGEELKPLGTIFVVLIKMMISPVIFCTIVLGIGSVRKAATVGRAGGMALVYFLVMSTFALAIGLLVGNLLSPGHGLKITPGGATSTPSRQRAPAESGTSCRASCPTRCSAR